MLIGKRIVILDENNYKWREQYFYPGYRKIQDLATLSIQRLLLKKKFCQIFLRHKTLCRGQYSTSTHPECGPAYYTLPKNIFNLVPIQSFPPKLDLWIFISISFSHKIFVYIEETSFAFLRDFWPSRKVFLLFFSYLAFQKIFEISNKPKMTLFVVEKSPPPPSSGSPFSMKIFRA